MPAKKKTSTSEQIKGTGETVLNELRKIVNEGNVRKITIKNAQGKSIAEFPLTVGVIGTALAPVLAAVGAIIALVAECSITIEREKE